MKKPKTVSAVTQALAGQVYEHAREGRLVLTLGGDHSIAIGTIAGVAKAVRERTGREVGVVWGEFCLVFFPLLFCFVCCFFGMVDGGWLKKGQRVYVFYVERYGEAKKKGMKTCRESKVKRDTNIQHELDRGSTKRNKKKTKAGKIPKANARKKEKN